MINRKRNSVPQLPSKTDLKQLIRNQTDASLTFAKQVSQSASKDSNLVFSPPLIHVVLGLIAAGSKGPTQSQVLSLLNSKSTDDLNSLTFQLVSLVFADGGPTGGPKLSFANGVWVDRSLSLKPSFEKVVDTVYKAVLNHVDFQTKADEVTTEVNRWAKKETNGLIKEVLPSGSVNNLTRLIFANALYFKGAWAEKFNVSKTKDQEFHLLNGSSVQVPFMTSKKDQFISEFNSFKVLRLPYNQGEDKRRFSMYLYLPNAKDGLSALMRKMSSKSGFLDRHLPCERVEVGEFLIPKFKFSFGFEASKVLKGLGLVLPFAGGEGLTEMVDSTFGQKLYISSIFHKACIEVNEEGTKAAAASAGLLTFECYEEPEEIDFVANHPFLFVIREDNTGAVLFIGQVLNPLVD
ncbi:serpin-ZX-like [Rhododendron vialii]|uniref:serpin-ZX-like n=1 Tax=Rhododendron vialii TaxID=182163 RepID=UPI00265E3D77|nr:serpin-ZX-like [Rhododendron vialii]